MRASLVSHGKTLCRAVRVRGEGRQMRVVHPAERPANDDRVPAEHSAAAGRDAVEGRHDRAAHRRHDVDPLVPMNGDLRESNHHAEVVGLRGPARDRAAAEHADRVEPDVEPVSPPLQSGDLRASPADEAR